MNGELKDGLGWLNQNDYVPRDRRQQGHKGNVRFMDLEYSGNGVVVHDEDILQGGRYSNIILWRSTVHYIQYT